MAENKTVESAASPRYFPSTTPSTIPSPAPRVAAPACPLATTAVARSFRHARGLAGHDQGSGPGPGVGGSGDPEPSEPGWVGGAVRRVPQPSLPPTPPFCLALGSHVRRGRGSEGRRAAGWGQRPPVTAAPRESREGDAGDSSSAGSRLSAAKALLFSLAWTSVGWATPERARVCLLLEMIETWHGRGKGRLLREECCVQSCNIATCQGSFVYLCKYYFPILSLSRLTISLLSLALLTSRSSLPLNELFRRGRWE